MNSQSFCEKVWKKIGYEPKLYVNIENFKKLSKIWNLTEKNGFWVKKLRKFGKSSESLEKVQKSSQILEIWKFQTFPKLQKNDVQLELRKLRKTYSDSKTDLKVRLKVWNVGS